MSQPPDPLAPISMTPVGVVRSPWKEKFSIPRQSGMASEVELVVELDPERIPPEALRGLEEASHLWLLCWFHACAKAGWRPTVRPPRLGGAARLGVFATRAPHRPNPIALSLVRLLAVEDRQLRVSGGDLLDGTPVLDIKPYLPWAELRPDASCEWAPSAPPGLAVRFSTSAAAQLAAHPHPDQLRTLIAQSLGWDPRPAHQRSNSDREFAAALLDVDVRFRVDEHGVLVLGLLRVA
ncbi:tRNA (N6-threonylcarbamoyladenosine(37)-N6)-methyltransferase TrmO [Enhygromyxa salina]|uniref:Putative tRNA (Adenine(37)-N6)-methyltransferase n=1 Tax=Enhygromyxa salina TaxID=215803 RepID=A0A2S9XWX1_9BACT|nr:tRNA (N6-threonylcarbamoyladenosine(37)-N6)-methyltransferase TrmO [Enhygromyxa salina]PRP97378.1 putative tRNA (adenine(37)-N6)-methyltransferase [Enhygromyxa salina]